MAKDHRPPIALDPSLAPRGRDVVIPLVAQVIALLVIQGLLLTVSSTPGAGEEFFSPGTAAAVVLSYVVLVVLTLWVAGRQGASVREVLGLVRAPLWRSAGLTALAAIAFFAAAAILDPIFHGAESQGLTPNAYPGGASAAIGLGLTFVGICLLGPFAEELYFRGLVYGAMRRWGAPLATLGSAAIFGAAHLEPRAFPVLFVLGAILAMLYERSGWIWPCVALHTANNTLALIVALSGSG